MHLFAAALKDDEGTIIENIGRHPSKPEKMAVTPDGKPSVTHYKVIERFQAHTLLDVTLETGRTTPNKGAYGLYQTSDC